MADVRTFRAESMKAALNQVQKELGSEAVILQTRQIPKRSYLPWRKRVLETEITAAIGEQQRPLFKRRNAPQKTRTQNMTTFEQSPLAANSNVAITANTHNKTLTPPVRAAADGVTLELRTTTVPSQQRSSRQQIAPGQKIQKKRTPTSPQSTKPLQQPEKPTTQKQNVASRVFTTRQTQPLATKPSLIRDEKLGTRLDQLQQLVTRLSQQIQTSSQQQIPNELLPLFNQLVNADVDAELANRLIMKLSQTCNAEQLNQLPLCQSLLGGLIEAELECSHSITPTHGRRKVVALVGPTGVGKTTTIAKLASQFRLQNNLQMGLITVDTYRIAAVEQLRTYAEIMDTPMKVVTNPLEMNRALDQFAGLDLVLIDTAGRSPRDELKIRELKNLIDSMPIDDVQLVISANTSLRSMVATAEKFSAVNTSSMILTKLDETDGIGTLLAMQKQVGLPISYLTTGQAVPDDIEPANTGRIARLILNQEVVRNGL